MGAVARRQTKPSARRLRYWGLVREFDARRAINTAERRRSIALRSWIGQRAAGKVFFPFPRLRLPGDFSPTARAIAGYVALAHVRSSPQLIAGWEEWSQWLDGEARASPSTIGRAIDQLVSAGVIYRRHQLEEISAEERAQLARGGGPICRCDSCRSGTPCARPGGRVFRACGYAPGPVMRAWFRAQRAEHVRPSVRRGVQSEWRSVGGNLPEASIQSTRARSGARPASGSGGKESRPTGTMSQHWKRRARRRRERKFERVTYWARRQARVELLWSLARPPRLPGELKGEGNGNGGSAAPASIEHSARRTERPEDARSESPEGFITPEQFAALLRRLSDD